ncbi:MAG TPA: hypothetical protein VFR03_05840 [Thermoanaerobaculia bacterium]|nr:hypothetical protein [Thermoanaerobaculia bacterium]
MRTIVGARGIRVNAAGLPYGMRELAIHDHNGYLLQLGQEIA